MRRFDWIRLIVASAFALAFLPVLASASDVKFGKWTKDPNNDRVYCEYQYPAKDDPTQISVQILIWYPKDDARKDYYYFANKDNKFWARCVCPSSPKYNPKVMEWSLLKGEEWENLPKGDCPAPKNGDARRATIDKIPDPPA